jgi:methyl-accepting chemotaxis protein
MKKSKISAFPILIVLILLGVTCGVALQVINQQPQDQKLKTDIATLNKQSGMLISALEQNLSSSGLGRLDLIATNITEYDEGLRGISAAESGPEIQNISVKWASLKPQLTKVVEGYEKIKELDYLDIKIQSEIIKMSLAAQKLLEEMAAIRGAKLDNGIKILSLTNNIAATTLKSAKKMTIQELEEFSDGFNSFDASLQSSVVGLSQDIKSNLVPSDASIIRQAKMVAEKRSLISELSRNRANLIRIKIDTMDQITLIMSEADAWFSDHDILNRFGSQVSLQRPINSNLALYMSIALAVLSILFFIYGLITTRSEKQYAQDENVGIKRTSEEQSKVLHDMLNKLKRMEAGELNIKLKEGNDSIGQIANAVNKVIHVLNKVVEESQIIGTDIASTSESATRSAMAMKDARSKQKEQIGDINTTSTNITTVLQDILNESNNTLKSTAEVLSMAGNAELKITTAMTSAITVSENQQQMANKTKSMIENVQFLRSAAIDISNITQEAKLVSINLGLIASEADGKLSKRINASAENMAKFSVEIRDYSTDVVKAADRVCFEAQETQRAIDGSIEATSKMMEASKVIKNEISLLNKEVSEVGKSADSVMQKVGEVGHMTKGIVNSVKNAQETAQSTYDDAEQTTNKIKSLSKQSSRIIEITNKFTTV